MMNEARAMAEMIAACNPVALGLAKRGLHAGNNSTLAEAMENEQVLGEELRAKKVSSFS